VVYGNAAAVASAVAPFLERPLDPGTHSLHELRARLASEARAAGARVMVEQLRVP
jgi:hypothetical protein